MRLTDEQQHRYRQRLMAQWQDGVLAGLMLAAQRAAVQGHQQLADDIRDTAVHYITEIANDFPVEMYEFEVIDA